MASRRGSGDGHFRSSGFYSNPFNTIQSIENTNALFTPKCRLNQLPLLYIIPQRLIRLAFLTAMAVPVVSAQLSGRDIVTMAWAFGIMANVPSVYVLANPPVPQSVDDGAEEMFWRIARGCMW